MIPTRTVKTMRTHQHVRTMRSALSSVRPTRDQWQRLRETEQIQHAVGRLSYMNKGNKSEKPSFWATRLDNLAQ